MGKSNAKKQRPCGYIKPHPGHTYDRESQSPQPGAVRSYERKLWCPGVATATAEAAHTHAWDTSRATTKEVDGKHVPWEGPVICACGKSLWLKDGEIESLTRFPHADALERIMALKAKLDSGGPDALDDADRAELEAIAADIVRILTPLMEHLQKLGEMITKMIQSFLDSLSPETVAYLSELGKSIGEKPDAVETVDLTDAMTGEVIATELLTPAPVSAASVAVTTGPIHIEPGQVIIGGKVMALDDILPPRAQRFGRVAEY